MTATLAPESRKVPGGSTWGADLLYFTLADCCARSGQSVEMIADDCSQILAKFRQCESTCGTAAPGRAYTLQRTILWLQKQKRKSPTVLACLTVDFMISSRIQFYFQPKINYTGFAMMGWPRSKGIVPQILIIISYHIMSLDSAYSTSWLWGRVSNWFMAHMASETYGDCHMQG